MEVRASGERECRRKERVVGKCVVWDGESEGVWREKEWE